MPALAHQYREELPRDSPSFFKSHQHIEGRQRTLPACDAPLSASGQRRKLGHVARLPLAETREAAAASTEGLNVGKENLAIVKEIRAVITSLSEDVKTVKRRQEEANTVTTRCLRISRQPKRIRLRQPTPDTA